MSASTAVQRSQFRAADQAQQSLEFAAIVGGGVELEGKSASIKSISECIQLSNALSLFSCSISLSSCYGFAGLRLRSQLGALDLHLDDGIAPPVEHPQKRAEGRQR